MECYGIVIRRMCREQLRFGRTRCTAVSISMRCKLSRHMFQVELFSRKRDSESNLRRYWETSMGRNLVYRVEIRIQLNHWSMNFRRSLIWVRGVQKILEIQPTYSRTIKLSSSWEDMKFKRFSKQLFTQSKQCQEVPKMAHNFLGLLGGTGVLRVVQRWTRNKQKYI